jgi:tRNA(fMet)-specific endonuclease VapC
MYFLDTNICIYYLKGSSDTLRDRLLETPPNEIKIPVIVHSELFYGVKKSKRKKKNQENLQAFLKTFEIVDYEKSMSQTYAEIRVSCESSGDVIGPNDLLIATITIAHNGTLVTRNRKEFSRIPNLKTEMW